MRIDFTKEERRTVDNARDAFHRAVLDVLKAHTVNVFDKVGDVTEVGESIALEGYAELED